jgi:hypothetical protein
MDAMPAHQHPRRPLDEVFAKCIGLKHCLLRAAGHVGDALENLMK